MAPNRRGVRYQPDPVESPSKLLRVIKDSGRSFQEAAQAIGIEPRRLKGIIDGKKPFPPLPEFVLVVMRALSAKGNHQYLNPSEFPGYSEWAEANPMALALAEHIANKMVGRYSDSRGRSGQKSDRQELFETLRAHGAAGTDRYWNMVIAGDTPFPGAPAKRDAIGRVIGKPVEQGSRTAASSRDRAAENLQALCRLVEAHARVFRQKAPGPRAPMILKASQFLPAPHPDLEPVHAAIRAGRRLEDIATHAQVRLEHLVALMLGQHETVEPQEVDHVVNAVRGLLGLPHLTPAQLQGKKRRPAKRTRITSKES